MTPEPRRQSDYRTIRGWGRTKNLDKPLIGRGMGITGFALALLTFVGVMVWRAMWEFDDSWGEAVALALTVLGVYAVAALMAWLWARRRGDS